MPGERQIDPNNVSDADRLANALQWIRLDLANNGEILETDAKRIEFIDSALSDLNYETDISATL